MTNEQIIKLMKSKISQLSTVELKKMIIKANSDMRVEAGVVLELSMNELEGRVSEEEFVNFCNQII